MRAAVNRSHKHSFRDQRGWATVERLYVEDPFGDRLELIGPALPADATTMRFAL
jgi:hypothetical protein